MTDAIFSTEPTTSPPQGSVMPVFRTAGVFPPAVAPTVASIPVVPPIIAQGAANAEGVGVLAGRGTTPMNTPLYSGGSTILAQLSTGAATMKSIP